MVAEFQLQVGDDRDQVGVTTALPETVNSTLHLDRPVVDSSYRVRYCTVSIVVSMDAKRLFKPHCNLPDNRYHFMRQRSAVSVAKNDTVSAALFGRQQTSDRVFRVILVSIEKV